MKKMIIAALQIISITAFSQKEELFFDYAWKPAEAANARYYAVIEKKDSLWYRQDYFIHERRLQMNGSYRDADSKVPHGQFTYFHPTGSIESGGRYVDGKREGLWQRYHPDGMISDSVTYEAGMVVGQRMRWFPNGFPMDSSVMKIDGSGVVVSWFDNGNPSSAGFYSAGGKKKGKWQYFHRNGQLSAIEVYDNAGAVISSEFFDESGKPAKGEKDREAEFPGGLKKWQSHIYKKIYFPERYQITNADQAVVVVEWVVNEDGSISNVRLFAPFHPDFDRIALDAIKSSPKWIPAVSNNRKVKAYRRQPVVFQN